jgi:2-C-methyl-D-erythritol 4-phosphate cytidylyltransferase
MGKKIVAIVLAGGAGKRMKSRMPKQFNDVNGKPIISYSLSVFNDYPKITDIVVVSHKNHISRVKEIVKKYGITKVKHVVVGGVTRQESSFIGIKKCPRGTDYVLIHDAARPFIDNAMVKRTINAAKQFGAVTTAMSVKDTVVSAKRSFIKEIPDRSDLFNVQTPQGFEYETIVSAHKLARKNGITGATDDTSLVMAMGCEVKVVKGSSGNFKITDKADMLFAEQRIRRGSRS